MAAAFSYLVHSPSRILYVFVISLKTLRMSNSSRNFWFGLIVIVVLVGLGYIFRPYATNPSVAGVSTQTPYTPAATSTTAGTLQGTVK